MEHTIELSGIDMNNRANISIYTQLIRFQADFLEDDTVFPDPDNAEQRVIHELAHSLGLEFEYSLATRSARVSRSTPLNAFSSASFPNASGTSGWTSPLPFEFFPIPSNRALGTNFLEGTILSTYSEPATHAAIEFAATSTNSVSSKRKLSSRKTRLKFHFSPVASVESSVTSPTSQYQEIIFDSCSGKSFSTPSISSSRRRSMDDISRAAMKAVKAVGACWRCKFLRKTCDTETPCLACPKPSHKFKKSNWEAVGCRRGDFQNEIPPLNLCPRSRGPTYKHPPATDNSKVTDLCIQANTTFHSAMNLRNSLIESIRTSDCPQDKFFGAVLGNFDSKSCWNPFHKLQFQSCGACESFLPATLTPLDECIIAIVWEAANSFSCRDVFFGSPVTRISNLWDLAVFIKSAASYQAKVKSNELILLSLICLRISLETLRLSRVTFSLFDDNHHQSCGYKSCRIESVSNLNTSVGLFLEELQRVFFKKENMRSKEAWWLSAFYSLTIQGFVKRALHQIRLDQASKNDFEPEKYIETAVRLFIASSGTYDPLMRNYAALGKESDATAVEFSSAINFQEAQLSLQQYKWLTIGTMSSANYLTKHHADEAGFHDIQSSRATPLSLRWAPDDQHVHLYKFVAPKSKDPYFELLPGLLVTPETPKKVFLDKPCNPLRKNSFPCLYPGMTCGKKVFTRSADLERHYKTVHCGPDPKDQFLCDYPSCQSRAGFTRKDHFRDHLRDLHSEDIGSAKVRWIDGKKSVGLKEAWAAKRKIHSTWWRCPKCLLRVQITDSGYECPDCKHPCDEERIKRVEDDRQKLRDRSGAGLDIGRDDQPSMRHSPSCSVCGNSTYTPSVLGAWDLCTECQYSKRPLTTFLGLWTIRMGIGILRSMASTITSPMIITTIVNGIRSSMVHFFTIVSRI